MTSVSCKKNSTPNCPSRYMSLGMLSQLHNDSQQTLGELLDAIHPVDKVQVGEDVEIHPGALVLSWVRKCGRRFQLYTGER